MTETTTPHQKLWYRAPARDWLEGLPIGTGRVAAMILGTHKTERVALNHEWLWKGEHRGRDAEKNAHLLPKVRKLLLAVGIARAPHLIVMDEPTNHMDLPSIECLEEALSGCPCGLLLVSHDRRFLAHLTTTEWALSWGQKTSRPLPCGEPGR